MPLTDYPDWSPGTFESTDGFGFFAGEYVSSDTIDNVVGACRGHGGLGSGYGNEVIGGQEAMFSPFASRVDVTSLDGSLFGIESVWVTLAWTTNLNLEFTACLGVEIVASRSGLLGTCGIPERIVYDEGFDGLFFDRLRIDSFGRTINPDFPSELVGDHFILDALTLTVPPPATSALLGLVGPGRSRRRH